MSEIDGKTILVTGGCGFIGAHVVRALLKHGATVIAYDDFSSLHSHVMQGARIVKGDILDKDALRDVMSGVDMVSHQAAILNMFDGIKDKVHELNVNTVGTINILDAALDAGVEKFIYASSCGMYGNSTYLPQDEGHPKNPAWPYGITKYAGELYCQLYTRLHGLPTVSLRYSEVYGPGEWYGRVMTLFIKRVLEGKPPVIFGEGKVLRDYVYIDDIVDANLLAIQNDEVNGMAFNIGGPEPLSAMKIAELVLSVTGSELVPVIDDPEPGSSSKYQPGRPRLVQELNDFVLDSSLAKERMKWEPKIFPREGITREIEWIRENPDAWNIQPRV